MTERLERATWRTRARRHRERAEGLLAGVLDRRRRGARHPVEDFLFDYYRVRPSELLAWRPGAGVVLEQGAEFLGQRWYRALDDPTVPDVVTVDEAAWVGARASTLRFTHALLSATSQRPARFGCFGMHEWAMVHGLRQDQVRHPSLPLRLGPEATEQVLDEVGLRCSHVDAFRFFTDTARPLNPVQLTRADQLVHDQPGCLHVGMDLYKWAGKLGPLVGSELLLDCFHLARDIRVLDMRASPYDLRGWGLDPVPVETAHGRADYVVQQRTFSLRAEVLRERLLEVTQEAWASLPVAP